jgi:hypothetical protein
MKKILILTDFSQASHHALAFARSFFSDTLAEFHLLTIYPAETDGFSGLKHNDKTALASSTDQLLTIVTKLHQEATNDWHTFRMSAQPGHPLDVVEQAIEAEPYDFVVIGPHTNGTNELFGNSAITLVHRLKANIVVVPTDAPSGTVYRIVLAADFANLKNAKLLSPLKELVTLKGASLTLLTIDTPDKDTIHVEQEAHIREFLTPIKPTIARIAAKSAKEGIDAYLADHQVDLLVTIPRHKGIASALSGTGISHAQAYTPSVPLLTLYDDDSNDLPNSLIDATQNVDYSL